MPTFLRGAKPSPGHVLAAAVPYRVLTAPAPQFGVVPPRLDMWGNDQYGDCVSAEEAFAKAWWSTYCGIPETFATAAEVVAFAGAHNWLNGAFLTEVMDAMIAEGMTIGGKKFQDGKYFSVDYSNQLVLQSAIDPSDGTGGPVKVAIAADGLPSGAGNQMGWFSTSGARHTSIDHCVSVGGYGRADYLYDLLKVNVPTALSASTPGYLVYTWKTVGFVTHDWIMGNMAEAWARNPTTPGQAPAPTPGPGPGPAPNPNPTPTPGPSPVTLPSNFNITFGRTTPWSNGLNVGSICSGTASVKINAVANEPAPAVKLPDWKVLTADFTALGFAIYTRNAPAIIAAVEKLAKDFGIDPTPND